MAARSTRNKIRFQAKKAADNLDNVLEHLAKLEMMADGRSDYINEAMPTVVQAVEGTRRVIIAFRDGL